MGKILLRIAFVQFLLFGTIGWVRGQCVVTSLADNGVGNTLRNVIGSCPAGNTITFSVPGTIQLQTQAWKYASLSMEKNLTIDGAGVITIIGGSETNDDGDAAGVSPSPDNVFNFGYNGCPCTGSGTLRGLTLIGGKSAISIGPISQNIFIENNNIGIDNTNNATTYPIVEHGIFAEGGTNINITGNVISGVHKNGIQLQNVTGGKISGNKIGTNISGTGCVGNQWDGVNIAGSTNLIIGGTSTNDRNIISCNGVNEPDISDLGKRGIYLEDSENNKIFGNYIGVGVNGNETNMGNYISGILLAAKKDNLGNITGTGSNNNIIGGLGDSLNVISGNGNYPINTATTTNPTYSQHGIVLTSGSDANRISNNLIGLGADNSSVPNNFNGIEVGEESSNNIIGGSTPLFGNVIGYNGKIGVLLQNGANANVVKNNYIGINKDGTNIGNGEHGVQLNAANLSDGVTAVDMVNNKVISNFISGNAGYGIQTIGANIIEGLEITGNIIGFDQNGLSSPSDLGNGLGGILFQTDLNGIKIQRNLIGDNDGAGINIAPVTAYSGNPATNIIVGNKIGVDSSGASSGNAGVGIVLNNNSQDIQIGSTGIGGKNFIAGNSGQGIYMNGSNLFDIAIINNDIGLNQNGDEILNTGTAIQINNMNGLLGSGTGIKIGGLGVNEGNNIVTSTIGIDVSAGITNAITSIQGNTVRSEAGTKALASAINIPVGKHTISSNEIFDFEVNGLNITGGTNIANNNEIYNTNVGVYVSGGTNTIGTTGSGNTLRNNVTSGLQLQNVSGINTVDANTIIDNGTDGILVAGTSTGVTIGLTAGNTISTNADHGINIINTANNIQLDNNTISENSKNGIEVFSSGADIIIGTANGNTISGNLKNGVNLTQTSNAVTLDFNTINANGSSTDPDAGADEDNGILIKSDNHIIGEKGGNYITNSVKNGISISAGSNNELYNNFIGVDESNIAAGNKGSGINIEGSTSVGNIIGSAIKGSNVISANSVHGIEAFLLSSINTISANIIGLDPTGTIDFGNGLQGVNLSQSSNIIVGGNDAADGNILSGNGNHGVFVSGTSNLIKNNVIGLSSDKSTTLGNSLNGVYILGATSNNNIVSDNYIGGNLESGVKILAATNTLVKSNIIGTNDNGDDLTNNKSNALVGTAISIASGSNTTIRANTISGTSTNSLIINGLATDTKINSNTIGSNTDLSQTLEPTNYLVEIKGGTVASIDSNSLYHTSNSSVYVEAGTVSQINDNTFGEDGTTRTETAIEVIGGTVTTINKNLIPEASNDAISITGGAVTTVSNNSIGNATLGTGTSTNGLAGNGLFISGVDNIDILSNTIGNIKDATKSSVLLDNSSSNTLTSNLIGIDVADASMNGLGYGVSITNGSSSNTLLTNSIAHNTVEGILISGATSTLNTISENSMFCNGATTNFGDGSGITLDAGNELFGIEATGNPLTSYSLDTIFAEMKVVDKDNGNNSTLSIPDGLSAFIASTNLEGAKVEIFENDPDCENCQGKSYLASTTITGGDFTYVFPAAKTTADCERYVITLTDATGNTSEFSTCSKCLCTPPDAVLETPELSYINDTIHLCEGTTYDDLAIVNVTDASAQYSWTKYRPGNTDTIVSGLSSVNRGYVVSETGYYFGAVQITTPDGNLCGNITDTVFIEVHELPTPGIIGEPLVCEDELGVEYQPRNTQDQSTFDWTITSDAGNVADADSVLIDFGSSDVTVQFEETKTWINDIGTDAVCIGDTTLNVAVRSLPTPDFVNDDVCGTDTIKIGANTSTNKYFWRINSGNATIEAGQFTDSITLAFTDVSGLINLTLIDSVGNCVASETKDISVIQSPSIDAGDSIDICANLTSADLSSRVNLTSALNFSSIVWSVKSTSGVFGAGNNPIYTLDGTESERTTLYATAIGDAPCASVVDSIILIKRPMPIPAIDGDLAVCKGSQNVKYLPQDTLLGSTFSWTKTEATVTLDATSKDSVLLDFVDDDTDLTLTETSSFTCIGTTTIIIDVKELGIIDFGVQNYCGDDTAKFVSTSVGNSYSWSLMDPTQGTVLFASSNADTFKVDLNDATLTGMQIKMIESIGNCSDSVVKSIDVFASVQLDAGEDIIICASETTTDLNLDRALKSTALNQSSLSWSSTNSGGFNLSTDLNPIYTLAAADNDTVQLFITAAGNGPCLSKQDTIDLIIVPEPVVDPGVDSSICQGLDFDFASRSIGTTVANEASFAWSFSPATSGVFKSGQTTLEPVFTVSNTFSGDITFTIEVTENAPCSDNYDKSFVLSTNGKPVFDAGNDDVTCENEALTLADGGTVSKGTFKWSLADPTKGTLTDDDQLKPTFTPNTGVTGKVILNLTVDKTDGCDGGVESMEVDVKPLPTPIVTGADEVCKSTDSNFGLTKPNLASTYEWYRESTGVAIQGNGITLKTSFTTLDSVYVKETTQFGCENFSPKHFVSVPSLDKPTVQLLPVIGICPGGSITVKVDPDSDTQNNWDLNAEFTYYLNGNKVSTSTSQTFTTTFNDNDIVTVEVTVDDGCSDETSDLSTPVQIEIFDLPVIDVNNKSVTICAGEKFPSVDVNTTNSENVIKYYWKYENVVDETLSTSSKILSKEGKYSVIGESDKGCLSAPSTTELGIVKPDVKASISRPSIVLGNSIVLSSSHKDTKIYTYEWLKNETNEISNFSSFRETPLAEDGQEVFYTVRATTEGCTAEDQVSVFVKQPIRIPNGFAPNGDNVNETWDIKFIELYPNAVVKVYNRWGNIVYKSENGYLNDWTGISSGGNELPVATYYYVIELNDEDFDEPYVGYVAIIK